MILLRQLFLILILLLLAACSREQKPRLVVVVALDHLAHFTYDHYAPVFSGGIRWLMDHGVSFENAHHEHGYCSTGPGHFVLGAGVHPGPAGMLGNHWYDRLKKKSVYCIEDPAANELSIPSNRVSYEEVNASSYGDWLKAASPASKVYGVACKDRAAILMSGKNPDLAIWYNWRGAFTTNDYYTDTIPTWLQSFNQEINILAYRDSVWNTSTDVSLLDAFTHGDYFAGETDRFESETYSPVFPKGFEPQWSDSKIAGEIANRPWMDRMTLELARQVVEVGELGLDDHADILNIGLSAMDIIAHYYGPYSHEVMDHLVKVDGYLLDFIEYLDQAVGLEQVVFVFSSDHGGLPLPEHRARLEKKTAGRVNEADYLAARAQAYAEIDSLYGEHTFVYENHSKYYYDLEMMQDRDVDPARIDSILQTHMEAVNGIHRLYAKAELLNATPADPLAYQLRNMMHPVLSPELYTLLDEGWLFRKPYGTSHSTPYDYDSHVPLIISSLNARPGRVLESVATVDLAVTVADILGVDPLNPVAGRSLLPLLDTAE